MYNPFSHQPSQQHQIIQTPPYPLFSLPPNQYLHTLQPNQPSQPPNHQIISKPKTLKPNPPKPTSYIEPKPPPGLSDPNDYYNIINSFFTQSGTLLTYTCFRNQIREYYKDPKTTNEQIDPKDSIKFHRDINDGRSQIPRSIYTSNPRDIEYRCKHLEIPDNKFISWSDFPVMERLFQYGQNLTSQSLPEINVPHRYRHLLDEPIIVTVAHYNLWIQHLCLEIHLFTDRTTDGRLAQNINDENERDQYSNCPGYPYCIDITISGKIKEIMVYGKPIYDELIWPYNDGYPTESRHWYFCIICLDDIDFNLKMIVDKGTLDSKFKWKYLEIADVKPAEVPSLYIPDDDYPREGFELLYRDIEKIDLKGNVSQYPHKYLQKFKLFDTFAQIKSITYLHNYTGPMVNKRYLDEFEV